MKKGLKGKKRQKKEMPYPPKALIKGALRRQFARSPMIRRVLEKAVHPIKKGIRGGKQFVCKKCKKAFPQKEVSVDHKIPVVPLNKTLEDMSYDEIVERIFCKEANLQVLCRKCHLKKTKEERLKRKNHRRD